MLACPEHRWQLDVRAGAPLGGAEAGLGGYRPKEDEGALHVWIEDPVIGWGGRRKPSVPTVAEYIAYRVHEIGARHASGIPSRDVLAHETAGGFTADPWRSWSPRPAA